MTFSTLLKKWVPFMVTKEMEEEFEQTKVTIGKNIILNIFDVEKPSLVVTDVSGDGFNYILLQKMEGRLQDKDGDWVVIQVGLAAL